MLSPILSVSRVSGKIREVKPAGGVPESGPVAAMASITIRKLEETTKRKLKVRAAMHGRSMEQEAREILNGALREKPLRQKRKSGADLVKRIREIFEPLGGVELEPFPREPMPDPDWLKDWKE